jgi:transcriptional regulator with XRE-family HTH domain
MATTFRSDGKGTHSVPKNLPHDEDGTVTLELMPSGPRTHEKQAIGQRVAAARRRAGLTQRELAEVLKVGVKTVQAWEQGRADPYRRTNDLERALSVEREWLFASSEEPSGEGAEPGVDRRVSPLDLARTHYLQVAAAEVIADLVRRFEAVEQTLRALDERLAAIEQRL